MNHVTKFVERKLSKTKTKTNVEMTPNIITSLTVKIFYSLKLHDPPKFSYFVRSNHQHHVQVLTVPDEDSRFTGKKFGRVSLIRCLEGIRGQK
jgi:hypothetical protein